MHTTITATQAAQKLNVSPYTIKRWIQDHKLNGEKINGKWFVVDDEQLAQHLHTKTDPQWCEDAHHLHSENERLKAIISEKESRIADQSHQLQEKDRQIETLLQQVDHLSQLLAVSHKSLQQVSERYQLLEDDTRKIPFWKRWFGKG